MKINIRSIILIATFLTLSVKSNSKKDELVPDSSPSVFFRENKGQVCDQNFKSRPDILFSGGSDNFSFFLKNSGISYQLKRIDSWKEQQNVKTKEKITVAEKITFYRIDINWLNTNPDPKVSVGESIGGYNNFYLEQCPLGALGVLSYKNITYKQLYRGIDLKWYEKSGSLKYDFTVASGSDYKQIKLEINGATKIFVSTEGKLVINTPLGDLIEDAPFVTQNGTVLRSRWVVNDKTVSFEIEGVDQGQELIIDPAVRIWSTYFGDSSYEIPFYNKTDQMGNVYLTGHTASTSNIATFGAHQVTFGGAGSSYGDAFIAKFNSSGALQWSTYYGGAGNDFGSMPSIDSNGNVYLVGGTTCTNTSVISTAGAHQTTFGGGSNWGDAFLVKFNSSGVRQWGTYLGGSGEDYGDGSTIDVSGNIYMVGVTQTTLSTAIASAGAHQSNYGGGINDGFIAKFSPSGVRLWSSYYGGSGDDLLDGCVCDQSKNVYFTGYTGSSGGTVIATTGSHQQSFNGGQYDGLLVKFDSTGTRQWGTYYGGSGDDYHVNIVYNGSGDLYIGGFSSTTTGTTIATPGSHQPTYGGGAFDSFLAKFNLSGTRVWATYYGSTGVDLGAFCAIDPTGNIYLAGRTTSTTNTLIATPCSYQPNFGGGSTDVFLSKFDSMGVRLWATYYGGLGTEDYPACVCDPSGNVYLSAPTSSSAGTIIASPGSQQPVYGGGFADGFLAKFDGCVPISPMNTTPVQNLTICSGNSSMLSATTTCGANWFSAPTGGSSLFAGSSFTTPTLTANSTYYIEEKSCGIAAPRTAVTVTVQICTSIEEVSGNFDSELFVYPNPTSSRIYIEGEELRNLVLVNAIGQQVSEVIAAPDKVSSVDVSKLPSGIYYIRGNRKDAVFGKKIIVQN